MRVGLLGGAFDPPHIGHLICAQHTLEELQLEKIIFIPSGDHPFKRSSVVAPAADRLAMTQLAIEGYAHFEVSDSELRRNGVTYMIDTIESIRQDHPDWELFLLIGADNIADFNKWRRYEDILATVQVVVFRRSTTESQLQRSDFLYPHTPIIDISSTEIRKRLREGKSVRNLVPVEVEAYMTTKNLYR